MTSPSNSLAFASVNAKKISRHTWILSWRENLNFLLVILCPFFFIYLQKCKNNSKCYGTTQRCLLSKTLAERSSRLKSARNCLTNAHRTQTTIPASAISNVCEKWFSLLVFAKKNFHFLIICLHFITCASETSEKKCYFVCL